MIRTSENKFSPAEIGDIIPVQVSDVVRDSIDVRNMLVIVTEIEDAVFIN